MKRSSVLDASSSTSTLNTRFRQFPFAIIHWVRARRGWRASAVATKQQNASPSLPAGLRIVYLRRPITSRRQILPVRCESHAADHATNEKQYCISFLFHMPHSLVRGEGRGRRSRTHLSCVRVCAKLTSKLRFPYEGPSLPSSPGVAVESVCEEEG